MNKLGRFPLIAIFLCALMPSCKQSSTPADGTGDDYVEGYIFTRNVQCEDSDESIPAGYFCYDDYEFPITDCYSCLVDSNNVLYYCPGAQDEIYFRGYLTKKTFESSTRHVKAHFDAPESWPDGQERTFATEDQKYVVTLKKYRINDPNAVLVLDEGRTESLHGKNVYTLKGFYECVFYRYVIVASYDWNESLTVNDSGYFNIVNNETNDIQPTSTVKRYPDIPQFAHLYFIEDSIITIDNLAYRMVK